MLDDALVHSVEFVKAVQNYSLNPCYAGRCSSTATTSVNPFDVLAVSILVMLDDALVLFGFILNGMIHLINVSILVMLDDALVHVTQLAAKCTCLRSQSLLCWTML